MELKNRSELVFLYDVRDANPNGDPDENKPRIDEETGINIVTDVRLKRTIRDYLRDFRDQDIFIQPEKIVEEGTELIKTRGAKLMEAVKEILDKEIGGDDARKIKEKLDVILGEGSKGKRQDKFNEALGRDVSEEKRRELFGKFEKIRTTKLKEYLFSKFIDLRLFGATLAVANLGVQEIGAVQFNFGRSLHKVDERNFYKGSITMPVEAGKGFKMGKKQAEFSEEYRLPYSLINFYGIVNENEAKNVGLTEEDVMLLLDGMWNGTKNLITRSKFGQMPRFLMRVVYNEGNYHIGDLDKKIRLLDSEGKEVDKDGKDGKEIRYISDVKLDITELVKTLKAKKDRIEKIQIEMNDDVVFKVNQVDTKGKSLVEELGEIEELKGKVEMLDLEK